MTAEILTREDMAKARKAGDPGVAVHQPHGGADVEVVHGRNGGMGMLGRRGDRRFLSSSGQTLAATEWLLVRLVSHL